MSGQAAQLSETTSRTLVRVVQECGLTPGFTGTIKPVKTGRDTPGRAKSLLRVRVSVLLGVWQQHDRGGDQPPRGAAKHSPAAIPQSTWTSTRPAPSPPVFPSATTSPPSSPPRTDSTNPTTSTAAPTSRSYSPAPDPETTKPPEAWTAREARHHPCKEGQSVLANISVPVRPAGGADPIRPTSARRHEEPLRPMPVGSTGVGARRPPGEDRLIEESTVYPFRARPVDVLAARHDGTLSRAEALAAWVAGVGAGDTTSLEIVESWIVVLVFQPSETDVLWVLPGQHLVLDRQATPRWRVIGAVEFDTLFVRRVRELPIFSDGEVA